MTKIKCMTITDLVTEYIKNQSQNGCVLVIYVNPDASLAETETLWKELAILHAQPPLNYHCAEIHMIQMPPEQAHVLLHKFDKASFIMHLYENGKLTDENQ